MNCEKVKDIILTDYLNREIKEVIRKDVDRHLAECKECSEYLQRVKEDAVDPLESAERVEVPESLWNNIHALIESQNGQSITSRFDIFLLKFRAIKLPKPALAFCSVVIAIVLSLNIVTKIVRNGDHQVVNTQERSEVIAFLEQEYENFLEPKDEFFVDEFFESETF